MAHKPRRQAGECLPIEVTDEMIEAGVTVIFAENGIGQEGIWFSGADLAERVYLAMEHCRLQLAKRRRHNRAE